MSDNRAVFRRTKAVVKDLHLLGQPISKFQTENKSNEYLSMLIFLTIFFII